MEVVRLALDSKGALVPLGGGTAIEQGNMLRANNWSFLSSQGMSDLVEFSPDDMVFTAQAGMPFAALQKILSEHGQFLPIDPPYPETATLGGIVATNAHGLWRPAFGAPRDRLLGLRVVLADGSIIRGGGKVVKNVAGYDLCKLFAGSWGTLGFFTEVTFKTNPLPAMRSRLTFKGPSTASFHVLIEAGLLIHAERLQPVSLTAVQPLQTVSSSEKEAALIVGLMGSAEAVNWQETEITRLLEQKGLIREETAWTEETTRHWVVDSGRSYQARIAVRPSDLPQVVQIPLLRDAALSVQIPTGIIEAGLPDTSRQADYALLRKQVQEKAAGSHLIWTRLASEMKAEIEVWGPTHGDFALMQGLKKQLDPNGLFSPGRFVGRL